MAALPGVPTMAETVPGFVVRAWFALVAPPKTPQAIVDKLNADINEALRDPEVRKRLAQPVGRGGRRHRSPRPRPFSRRRSRPGTR